MELYFTDLLALKEPPMRILDPDYKTRQFNLLMQVKELSEEKDTQLQKRFRSV